MEDITKHLRLVHHVIKKYRVFPPKGLDYDDLFQIGCIGLMSAAKKYEESDKKYTFASFAILYIRSELHREMMLYKRAKRTAKTVSVFERRDGDEVSILESIAGNDNTESEAIAKIIADELSEKDRIVGSMLVKGYTQKQIGKALAVSSQRISVKVKKLREYALCHLL